MTDATAAGAHLRRLGRRILVTGAGGLLLASAATAAPATYRLEANTVSGMTAGGSGLQMMRMMMGGSPPAASRILTLTLESPRSAPAAPEAVHAIPPALGLGTSLRLVSTPPGTPAPTEPAEEKPTDPATGRLVIFRGCAGSAGADQPEILDLATLMPDQRQLALARAQRRNGGGTDPADAGTPVTVGHWPAGSDERPLPARASLVGSHAVTSNYAPEIRFQVDAAHDFLAPVTLRTGSSGEALELSWDPIPTALGSQASAFGSGEGGELVIWTSSTAPWSESAVPDDLDAATARRLVSRGVLMPPEQTRCTISAAAMKRLGAGALTLKAYGAALRIAAPAAWRLTLVRNAASTLPLMAMPGGSGADEAPGSAEPTPRGGGGGWRLLPGLF